MADPKMDFWEWARLNGVEQHVRSLVDSRHKLEDTNAYKMWVAYANAPIKDVRMSSRSNPTVKSVTPSTDTGTEKQLYYAAYLATVPAGATALTYEEWGAADEPTTYTAPPATDPYANYKPERITIDGVTYERTDPMGAWERITSEPADVKRQIIDGVEYESLDGKTWTRVDSPTIDPAKIGTTMWDDDGYEVTYNPKTGAYDIKTGKRDETQSNWWKQTQASQAAAAAQQEQLIAWYREQAAMEAEQERQRTSATLKANPQTWMESNVYDKTAPAVQPWQIPMMGQQYMGVVAGDKMPGWGDVNAPTLANIPALLNMSRQYQARMSPEMWGQYQSYQKARTGQTAEGVDAASYNTAPPTGRNTGVTWMNK